MKALTLYELEKEENKTKGKGYNAATVRGVILPDVLVNEEQKRTLCNLKQERRRASPIS